MDLNKSNQYIMPMEQMEYDRQHVAERVIYYIGCFMGPKEILRRFGYTTMEMDKACKSAFNTGMDFNTIYQFIRSDVVMQGKQIIEDLAIAGNPSALKMFGEYMLKLNQEEESESRRLTINIDV